MIININTDVNNEKMKIDDNCYNMLELLYFILIFIYFLQFDFYFISWIMKRHVTVVI